MSVSRSLLGLLEAAPRHGYDLKRAHDEWFRAERPLAYGQVYATLSRFLKSGMVTVDGTEPGDGPDRKWLVRPAQGHPARLPAARISGGEPAAAQQLSSAPLGRISWVAALNPAHGARLRATFDAITWEK